MHKNSIEDTIVAPATPIGEGGIGDASMADMPHRKESAATHHTLNERDTAHDP